MPAFIFLAQMTIMNAEGYKTMPELERKIEKAQDVTRDVHDSDDDLSDNEVRRLRERRREHRESHLARIEELVGDAKERQARIDKQEEVQAISGVWGMMHAKSTLDQMLSPWFVLITLLTV